MLAARRRVFDKFYLYEKCLRQDIEGMNELKLSSGLCFEIQMKSFSISQQNTESHFRSSQKKKLKLTAPVVFAQLISSAPASSPPGTSVTMRCQAINPFSGISLSKNRGRALWLCCCVVGELLLLLIVLISLTHDHFLAEYCVWDVTLRVFMRAKSFYTFCMYESCRAAPSK